MAQANTSVYDADGRLRAVTTTVGTNRYVYDAQGNLLRVDQLTSSQLAIYAFLPTSGMPGTSVTILGQGFSTTTKSNVVKFNGITATVSASTATQLTTSVPSGATTGKITVTVGATTATSDDTFTVNTTTSSPTITSVSPSIGTVGSIVVVNGTNLYPTPSQTYLAINGTNVPLSAESNTQLQFVLPSNVGSGKIAVTTPDGTAVSSADFYALPSTISAANVATETRAAVGGTASINVQQGMYAAILFNASANSWLSFQASNISSGNNPIVYTVYDTNNREILSGTVSASSASIHLPSLSNTGTYSVWFSPVQSSTSMTLQLVTDQLLAMNTPLTMSSAAMGQSERAVFGGSILQSVALQVSNPVTTPTGGIIQYGVYYAPLSSQYNDTTATTGATLINVVNLVSTGPYALVVSPSLSVSTFSTQVEMVSGNRGTLAVNGIPQTIATTWPGQNQLFNFTASAGESVGIGISMLSLSPDSMATIQAYDVNNNFISSVACSAGSQGCSIDLQNLAGGIYKLVAATSGSDMMVLTTSLTPDLTGSLSLNTATSIAMADVGQTDTLTFNGVAGSTLALQVSGFTTTPSSCGSYIYVYSPTGSTVSSIYATSNTTLNLPDLPSTGIYKVYVVPQNCSNFSAQLELTTGVTTTLPTNGSSQAVSTSVAGENAYINFTATAGANLGLGITGLSISNDSYVNINVYDANGNFIANSTCAKPNGCTISLPNLAGGAYQAVMSPIGNDSVSFSATLSQDVLAPLTVGATATLNLSVPGQVGLLTFAGTSGQTLALVSENVATSPAGANVYYTVYAPNGSELTSSYSTGSTTVNMRSLPTTGTYQIYVVPNYGTSTAQLQLETGVTGALNINGSAQSFSTEPGENAYLSFTAQAGSSLGLGISGLHVSPDSTATVNVYDANNNYIMGMVCSTANACGMSLPNLTGGTYEVVVSPPGSSDTMSFNTTLTQDQAGTLTPNTPLSVNLATIGQTGLFTFAGTAGQNFALEPSSVSTTPSGFGIQYTVFTPTGTQLLTTSSTGSTTINLSNLPTTGTYEVVVEPANAALLTEQLELAPQSAAVVTGTLTVNGSLQNFVTTVPGESVDLMFTATAGQSLGLGITGLSVTSGSEASVTVYDSNNDVIAATGNNYCQASNGGCALDLQNLAGGTYQVIVSGPTVTNSVMLNFNAVLSQDVSATLTASTPLMVNLPNSGQTANLSFAGTAGQSVVLHATDVGGTPFNAYIYYYLYAPGATGSSYYSYFYAQGSANWTYPSLPSTGTYRIYIVPYNAASGAATYSAQIEVVP